jgi:hypothetical protein
MLIAVYSILAMDYKNPMHSKAARERIALAASTMVWYDVGYRKVIVKTMITRWINQLEHQQKCRGIELVSKASTKEPLEVLTSVESTSKIQYTYLPFPICL